MEKKDIFQISQEEFDNYRWQPFTIFLTVLTIIVMIGLYNLEKKDDFERRKQIIRYENTYNIEAIKSFLEDVNNPTEFNKKIFWGNFSTDVYKQNWDVISTLSPDECIKYQFELIGTLTILNKNIDLILNLETQKGLVYEDVQIEHTEGIKINYHDNFKKPSFKS